MQRLLSFNYIYLIPLFLSAIFSLKSFRLKWPICYKIFSLFLISTFLIEALAILWKWYIHRTAFWHFSPSNMWIYNGFTIIRMLFYSWFFYLILTDQKVKKLLLVVTIISFVTAVLNYALIQTPHYVNTYSIILTNGLIILLTLAFFHQLLADSQVIKLQRHPGVWIALGSLLYYSGSLPFFIFFNYLLSHHYTLAQSYLYINDVLNIIMYSCFIITFLCRPQIQK
jgi:hypothetical protein